MALISLKYYGQFNELVGGFNQYKKYYGQFNELVDGTNIV